MANRGRALGRAAAAGVLGLLGLAASPAGADERPPTLDRAIAAARQAGTPLLVEFAAVWCKPCVLFEREVLPQPEVQAALQGLMFVRYDGERPPGDAAAARLDVKGYPTFIALDGQGRELLRKAGMAGGPASVRRFVAFLERVHILAGKPAAGPAPPPDAKPAPASAPGPAASPAGAKPAPASGPPPGGDEAPSAEAQRFLASSLGIAMHVGTLCATHAGALGEAYVRLALAPAGGPPRDVVLLEPGAPAALRTCLANELKAVTLPAPPAELDGRYVMPISFRRRPPRYLVVP